VVLHNALPNNASQNDGFQIQFKATPTTTTLVTITLGGSEEVSRYNPIEFSYIVSAKDILYFKNARLVQLNADQNVRNSYSVSGAAAHLEGGSGRLCVGPGHKLVDLRRKPAVDELGQHVG